MISVPITECFVPFNVLRLSSDDKFGLFRVTMLRYVKHVTRNIELMITFIGGKNLATYTKDNKEKFTESVKSVMTHADYAKKECETWKKEMNKEYIIILCKDHSARIDAFNVDSFLGKCGRRWNMPTKEEGFSDPAHQSGWLDINGWYCSDPSVKIDLMISDYDDHSPSLYTIFTPYDEVLPSVENRYLKRYYMKGKWMIDNKYKQHDGSIITEAEYQAWRRNHRIDYS